jgi:hypothetical protein
MSGKDRAKDRVAKTKVKHGARLTAWHYVVDNEKGFREAVLCKKCGASLAALVEHEHGGHSRVENGQVVKYRFLVMANLPTYDTVIIEFDDGSAHETPICKTCKPTLDADDLEAIYVADLDQAMKVDRGDRLSHDNWADRKPVKVKTES